VGVEYRGADEHRQECRERARRAASVSESWERSPCNGQRFPISANDVHYGSGKKAARNLESRSCMRVRDLMEQDVLTLDSADSLDLVDDLMNLGRIRHMPIRSAG